MNPCIEELNDTEKVALFRSLFGGLTNVYGTYDPSTRRARVVKEPVTDQVIRAHINGKKPYGVFLLNKNRTVSVVADFDDPNPESPNAFINRAAHYGLTAYLEKSKSKGYHAWIFLENEGVTASKARLIVSQILREIEIPETEIFPKQDKLDSNVKFGNFIYTPLYGYFVAKGRTVFIDPSDSLKPYPDQWKFLQSVQRFSESHLDEIIEINDLQQTTPENPPQTSTDTKSTISKYGLPPCAQRILNEGVKENQRDACFRMAVHLKRTGIPFDVTIATLKYWAQKNRPINRRRIITEAEIVSQTRSAYKKDYRRYGCETAAIIPYCDPTCPLSQNINGSNKANK
jgi:hypothetical protein